MAELSPAQRAWWELASYCRVLWQALYNSPTVAEADGACGRMADAMARRAGELGIRADAGWWSPSRLNKSHRPAGDDEEDGA